MWSSSSKVYNYRSWSLIRLEDSLHRLYNRLNRVRSLRFQGYDSDQISIQIGLKLLGNLNEIITQRRSFDFRNVNR